MSCSCLSCSCVSKRVVEPLLESTLYIVMRSDLASLNPGKAMAQAAHAGQMFQSTPLPTGVAQSFNGGRNFGRTIVLAGPDGNLFGEWYKNWSEAFPASGIVHDPTYPLCDGTANLLVGVDTCIWVFVEKGKVPPKELHELELHP